MASDPAYGPGREGPVPDEPCRDGVPPEEWEYDEGLWRDEAGPGIADDDEPDMGVPDWVLEVTGTTGFEAGGVLDVLEPCGTLAGVIGDVTRADDQNDPGYCGLSKLDDDALTGVLRAWRRLESWCAAGGLAAVAELARRRPVDGTEPDIDRKLVPSVRVLPPLDRTPAGQPTPEQARACEAVPSISGEFPSQISQFTSDEVAAALVLSGPSAGRHLDLALDLAIRLPRTNQALHTGVIDLLRARILAEVTQALDADGAARAEAMILSKAANMTPGQLRTAIARAVLTVDPEAAQRRREQVAKDARVTRWREDAGTAALCGRDLPPAEVLAADQRITDRAHELRAAGVTGTMDELRARAYLDFLLDRPLPVPEPEPVAPSVGATSGEPGGEPSPGVPGSGLPPGPASGNEPVANERAGGEHPDGRQPVDVPSGLAARINLTVPLTTLLRLNDHPGEAAGFGPLDADVIRTIVAAASSNPFTSWCLTITDPDGQAIGHGCGKRRRRAAGPPGRDRPPGMSLRSGFAFGIPDGLSFTIDPIAVGDCGHRHESRGYELSRRLRHLIETRSARCTFPGCRRPAVRCDQDHTKPYDQGGRTCECNLGPLCRHHHRTKQACGWRLEQLEPGMMAWTAPSGRRYVTVPTSHPG
jgi:Domain of unknown function (DUF222)